MRRLFSGGAAARSGGRRIAGRQVEFLAEFAEPSRCKAAASLPGNRLLVLAVGTGFPRASARAINGRSTGLTR